ncbi:MAG: DUF4358 domain-containing protein [Butyricicoccus sp.]|nr:DUF4358 domain-containing protein [Butyricicoccus sp.]
MKNKKRFGAAVLALAMVFALLCACGSAAKDVAIEDVVSTVDTALNKGDNLVEVDANYIKGYMKIDAAAYEGFTVKINAYGANIDEYGVFKAKDSAQAKEAKAAVEGYLQLRLDSWMDAYMPEEKPKLTSAEIKTSGNYVMYCILSDADKSAAFGAFDGALK